jgi:hypothetical protein
MGIVTNEFNGDWMATWESPRRRRIDRYLKAAEVYAGAHGNLAGISAHAVVPLDGEEVRIGAWVNRVRQGRTRIDESDRKKLTLLGMCYESQRAISTRRLLRAARVYVRSHGDLRSVPQKTVVEVDGTPVRLGAWLDRVRGGRTKIDETTRRRLSAWGLRWDVTRRSRTEDFLRAAEAYAVAHGSLAGARHDTIVEVNASHILLGPWLTRVRGRQAVLSEDLHAALTTLGMRWHGLPSESDYP